MILTVLRRFRFLLLGLGILGLALLVGAVYQARKTTADLAAFPAPGHMVTVNGVSLHLWCMGSGSPTLVLEAGLGESALSWHPVHSRLAQNRRVCAYDRPGLGWSEPIDTPAQPDDVARNLHSLLRNAGVAGPYVLAGHSRGGIYVRAFHRLFPGETLGIVLVDSTHEQGPLHQYPHAKWDYRKQAIQIAMAEPLSRVGLVRLLGIADAGRRPSPLPPDVLAAKTAVQNRSDTARAVVNEITVMRQGLNAGTPPPTPLGKLPLLVLTAGNLIDEGLIEREAQKSGRNIDVEKALARIRRAEQDDLARLSSQSRHLIVRNSGHLIMQDQPDELVRAVNGFLESLAQGAAGR